MLIFLVDSNWLAVSPKLKQKSLKATVLEYKEVSVEALKGKKKDETVVKTNKICQVSGYLRFKIEPKFIRGRGKNFFTDVHKKPVFFRKIAFVLATYQAVAKLYLVLPGWETFSHVGSQRYAS